MRAVFLSLVIGAALSSGLAAQQPAPASAPPGAVFGYVTCADTRLPARLALVMLQPVVPPPAPVAFTGRQIQEAATKVVETLLDGSFRISGVAPGDYYVIAEEPGYISPLAQFSKETLSHPTTQMLDQMAALLTPVTVTSSGLSRADVRLIKGAAIAGRVTFEDGMPETNSRVVLLHKDATGHWANFYQRVLSSDKTITDDQGRFRIAGIPAGEYKMYAGLDVQDMFATDAFSWGHTQSAGSASSIQIFFGNGFRQQTAKVIKLTGGEDPSLGDIEIQMSKLHSISGTVVDVATGQIVNSGNVRLLDDAGNAVPTTAVVGDDGSYHFAFVPEGTYTLILRGGHQIIRESMTMNLPNLPAGVPQPIRTTERPGTLYEDYSQPIIVHGDTSGVTIQLTAKPPAPKTAAN